MNKSYKHLTITLRHEIKALHQAGHSSSFIGTQLGVHKSTVCRELKRNARQWGSYDPKVAQQMQTTEKNTLGIGRLIP